LVLAEPWIEILLFAAAFSLLNTYLTRAMGIRKRMNHIQEEFKAYQEKYLAAVKAKDERKLEALAAESKRTNDLMMEMMIMPWKTLVFALPLFFLFTGDPWLTHYAGIIPSTYPAFATVLPFDLHPAAVYSLNILRSASYGPRGYFIVCLIFAGLLVSLLEQNYDRKGKAQKKA
jgi:uncharacterized membrane protein (DUF106 family)